VKNSSWHHIHSKKEGLSLFFSDTDKVFFKAPITTGFWLESTEFGISFFDWSDEIQNIFTDEDLEYKISSFSEKYIGNFDDRKIEFDRSILIYTGHASCSRGDI